MGFLYIPASVWPLDVETLGAGTQFRTGVPLVVSNVGIAIINHPPDHRVIPTIKNGWFMTLLYPH